MEKLSVWLSVGLVKLNDVVVGVENEYDECVSVGVEKEYEECVSVEMEKVGIEMEGIEMEGIEKEECVKVSVGFVELEAEVTEAGCVEVDLTTLEVGGPPD